MFSTILKIIPVIDPARAKAVEQTLSKRFGQIARTFGEGLKAAMKASFLGLSLGLLNKLLNPLNETADKIKELLKQGQDVGELSQKYGTTPGALRQSEAIAQSVGLAPDKFREMLEKFSDALETAEKELADKFAPRSEATRAVQDFVGRGDKLAAFNDFLTSLQNVAKRGNHTIFFGDLAQGVAAKAQATGATLPKEVVDSFIARGEAKALTGFQYRQLIEKNIFGESLYGAASKYAWMDREAQAKLLGPNANLGGLNNAIINLQRRQEQHNLALAKQELYQTVAGSGKINSGVVSAIDQADAVRSRREIENIDRVQRLVKVQEGIDKITEFLGKITDAVLSIAVKLSEIIEVLTKGRFTAAWKMATSGWGETLGISPGKGKGQ